MGLADQASDISDAIEAFLRQGGTAEELRQILDAWTAAVDLVITGTSE